MSRQLLDAAEFLGASKVQAFSKVLLPAVYPGLFARCVIIVFCVVRRICFDQLSSWFTIRNGSNLSNEETKYEWSYRE